MALQERKLPNIFQKINGWIRLFIWSVCPECNHSAPKLYDCTICEYYKYLPKYRDMQSKDQKDKVWFMFINDKWTNPPSP